MIFVSRLLLAVMLVTTPPAVALGSLQSYEDENEDEGLDVDLEMAPQVALAANFTLKSTIETAQTRLFLGELASCSGHPRICGEAYAIDLGASPEPGRSTVWHSEKLMAILGKEWPGAQLQMHGPKMVKVASAAVSLDEVQLLAELRARFEPVDAAAAIVQVVVEHVTLVAPVKVHPGELVFEFPDLTDEHLKHPAARMQSGTQRLTVVCRPKAAAPDEASQSFAVHALLTVKARHWTLVRPLTKGALLQASDLNYDWLAASRVHARYPENIRQLVGHRLRHPVAAAEPLLLTDVETPRLLKRGQMATLQLHNRGLNVSSQVRILADASAGQQVEAVYLNTKKKLRVQAIDSHTVQLAF